MLSFNLVKNPNSASKSEICLRKLFKIVTHLYKHFTPQNFNKWAKNEKMSLKSACCQKNNPAVFHYLEWFFGVVYLRRLVTIFIYYNFYFNHFFDWIIKKTKNIQFVKMGCFFGIEWHHYSRGGWLTMIVGSILWVGSTYSIDFQTKIVLAAR